MCVSVVMISCIIARLVTSSHLRFGTPYHDGEVMLVFLVHFKLGMEGGASNGCLDYMVTGDVRHSKVCKDLCQGSTVAYLKPR